MAIRWVLAALMAGLVPTSALADAGFDDVAFPACDGFEKPGHTDAYLRMSLLYGLASASADIRATPSVQMGQSGVQECDLALASPLLKPEFTYRRSHLLIAKALHLLAAGHPAEALAVLDQEQAQADQTVDALRAGGFGIAGNEVRALALADLGRKDEALAKLRAIEVARPYAVTNLDFVRRARLHVANSYDAYLAGVRALAPLNPGTILEAMIGALELGRINDTLALGRGLTVALPRLSGAWRMEAGAVTQYDLITFDAAIEGLLAYAETTHGDSAAGAARLDALAAKVEGYAARPPEPAPGENWSRSVSDDFNHRLAASGTAKRMLDGWRAAVRLRQDVPLMTGADFQKRVKDLSADVRQVVWFDLIGQIGVVRPGEDVAIRNATAQGRSQVLAGLLKNSGLDYGKVLERLPRAETVSNQPKLHKAGDGFFLSDNGYSSHAMDLPDRWTVSFVSLVGSIASIEEQAMFNIATLARSKGRDRFIIESRRDVPRITNVMWYGRLIRRENAGHEAQFVVRLLPLGPLPADLAGAEWRVITVETVLSAFPAQAAATKS